jgi:hypothetical protein
LSRELVAAAARSRSTVPGLLLAVRIRRVAGAAPPREARTVALAWNPSALLSRGIVVRGLGAQRLTLETTSAAADVPLPRSMALPIEVGIEHLGVGELDWRVGTRRGTIRGSAFAYPAGGAGHRVPMSRSSRP